MSPTATKTGERKAPSITSLDTQGTSCTIRSAIGLSGGPGDPPWAFAFRDALAPELEVEWPARATALRRCGRAAHLMECRACGELSIFPERCGARTCPECARRAAHAIADRAAARVALFDILQEAEPWEGPGRRQRRRWKHLVTTSPASLDVEDRFDLDPLAHAVDRVLRACPRFWRGTPWGRQIRDPKTGRKRARRDTAAIRAIEIAPDGMVHVHWAVYGEYVVQAELQPLWERALGVELAIVHIRDAGDVAGTLQEVLKYATAGESKIDDRSVRHAAAVELALRQRRRVEYVGAIRNVKVGDAAGPTDDVRPEDLHDCRVAVCEACGVLGEWRWGGSLDPETVERNGGFGLLLDMLRTPSGLTAFPSETP